MEKQQPKVDRKVIPRWRSLGETPRVELVSNSVVAREGDTLHRPVDVLDSWHREPAVETASELLATAPLFGPSPEIAPAAAFLRQRADVLSAGVARLVEWYDARTAIPVGGDESVQDGFFNRLCRGDHQRVGVESGDGFQL